MHPYLSGSFITGTPRTGQTHFPPATSTGQRIGGSDLAQNDQNFFRDEYRLQGSYLATFLGATHDIRGGSRYFSNNREEAASRPTGGGRSRRRHATRATAPAGNADGRPATAPATRLPDQQVSRAKTYGVFLQDQVTWDRLTVNLGVLVNEDYYIPNDNQQFTYVQGDFTVPGQRGDSAPAAPIRPPAAACTYTGRIDIPWSKQFQPRIGVAYEVDARPTTRSTPTAAATTTWTTSRSPARRRPLRLLRVDAYFNITTGALIQEVIRANQTGKLVIPGIDPTYTDELIVGYARPFGSGWSAELWGMYRHDATSSRTSRPPVTARTSATGTSRLSGDTGRPRSRSARPTAATGRSTRPTRSRSSTGTGTSTTRDVSSSTPPPTSETARASSRRIRTTRGSCRATGLTSRSSSAPTRFPTKTIVGGYLRFQSGKPWEARGFDPVNGTTLMPIEPAGSRQLSSWTNFDLLVAQNIPIGPANLRLEARLLNVFNSQPALTVDQDLWINDDNTGANPNFGKATSYAPPRGFILSATFNF